MTIVASGEESCLNYAIGNSLVRACLEDALVDDDSDPPAMELTSSSLSSSFSTVQQRSPKVMPQPMKGGCTPSCNKQTACIRGPSKECPHQRFDKLAGRALEPHPEPGPEPSRSEEDDQQDGEESRQWSVKHPQPQPFLAGAATPSPRLLVAAATPSPRQHQKVQARRFALPPLVPASPALAVAATPGAAPSRQLALQSPTSPKPAPTQELPPQGCAASDVSANARQRQCQGGVSPTARGDNQSVKNTQGESPTAREGEGRRHIFPYDAASLPQKLGTREVLQEALEEEGIEVAAAFARKLPTLPPTRPLRELQAGAPPRTHIALGCGGGGCEEQRRQRCGAISDSPASPKPLQQLEPERRGQCGVRARVKAPPLYLRMQQQYEAQEQRNFDAAKEKRHEELIIQAVPTHLTARKPGYSKSKKSKVSARRRRSRARGSQAPRRAGVDKALR